MMRSSFDSQLRQLNNELIEMGALCEEAITLSAKALAEGSAKIAGDNEIDKMERDIETLCLKLLLRQQPVAGDLRQISAALKMITDMERIGDQAEDIAEIIAFLNGRSGAECGDIDKMAKAATKMVTNSIEAFVKRDVELAKEVIAQDDIVDDYFNRVKQDLIERISSDPSDGEFALDLLMIAKDKGDLTINFLMIAKYFERIGDHATNIAEWVMFSVTGVHVQNE